MTCSSLIKVFSQHWQTSLYKLFSPSMFPFLFPLMAWWGNIVCIYACIFFNYIIGLQDYKNIFIITISSQCNIIRIIIVIHELWIISLNEIKSVKVQQAWNAEAVLADMGLVNCFRPSTRNINVSHFRERLIVNLKKKKWWGYASVKLMINIGFL